MTDKLVDEKKYTDSDDNPYARKLQNKKYLIQPSIHQNLLKFIGTGRVLKSYWKLPW